MEMQIQMQIQNLYRQFALKKQNEITLAAPDLQKKIKKMCKDKSTVRHSLAVQFTTVHAV